MEICNWLNNCVPLMRSAATMECFNRVPTVDLSVNPRGSTCNSISMEHNHLENSHEHFYACCVPGNRVFSCINKEEGKKGREEDFLHSL